MLLSISTQKTYLDFLDNAYRRLDNSDRRRLRRDKYQKALEKMKLLDPAPIESLLLSCYSQLTGRPAHDPVYFLRSFILMQHFDFSSIEEWIKTVQFDRLYQYLLGSWFTLPASTHYDFINRIMQVDPHMDELYPYLKNSSENKKILRKLKLKVGEKWENYDEGDTRDLKIKYQENADCDANRSTLVMEKLFSLLVVKPSIEKGLIPTEHLVLSGDGSSLHIHANAFGHKIDNPEDDDHAYRYTAPDADIGWDSDIGVDYFGYTMYNISVYNKLFAIDLPVFITQRTASQHDSLTTITAAAHFFDINPDIHPEYMCYDSASDSVHIFEYFRKKGIIPIIDWNQRRSDPKNPYVDYEFVNENGIPVCMNGIEMCKDGYDKSKMAAKFRCPLATGRIKECPYSGTCSPSPYGRVIKIYDKTNYKLFGPVPYKSDLWKKIYKNRTCTERINNRILNDYGLHKTTCRNGSKHFFLANIAGINIHLDAWVKTAA